jgi:hypothetical protein
VSFRTLDTPPSGLAAPNLPALAGAVGAILGWLRQARDVINSIMRGKLNCTGAKTLSPGAATTTLADQLIGGSSIVLLQPITANAAAELGNGTLYFDPPAAGSVVIHHANNAQTDRPFNYVVIG